MDKNKELVKECFSLFTDYNLRFDKLEFLHSFINADVYNKYHRKVVNRLKRLEVLHNV